MADEVKTMIPGHDAAVEINGVMFGVRRSKATRFAEVVDVGDTEDEDEQGVIFIKTRAGRRQAILSFDFYEDRKRFPWSELNVKEGNTVAIRFWRSFATDEPSVFPKVVLAHYEAVQNQERPFEGSLAGKTDGRFMYPDES